MATVYYSNLQYTVDISRPKWVDDHRMMGLIPLRAASKITCHSGHQWTWSFNDSNSLQGRRAGMSSCSNWSFPICECEMPVLGSHHGLCLHSLCHIYIYPYIHVYIYIHTLALISIRSVRCSAKCHELFGSVLRTEATAGQLSHRRDLELQGLNSTHLFGSSHFRKGQLRN